MPDDVLNKIKYLCQLIPRVEWSGILLYSVEGTIKEPEKMVITLKDIIPMNKGSQAYTEYNFNEKKRDTSGYLDRHIDYTNEREEALEWHLGHIHSHNTMGVFFSGTDMAELDDNSSSHNFYLSLIVNNFMDFTAKVAFRAVAETQVASLPYNALDENGDEYTIDKADFKVSKEKLFMYDCDIQSNKENITIDDLFAKSVDEIIKEADKRVVKTTNYGVGTHRTTPVHNYGRDWNSKVNHHQQKREEDFKSSWNFEVYPYNEKKKNSDAWGDSWDARNYSAPIIEEDEDEVLEDAIEDFTMFILNTGDDTVEFYNITNVVKNYKRYNLSGRALAKEVLDKYVPLYEKFFDELPDKDDPKMFTHITEQVIENLEDERDSSTLQYMDDMLSPTIKGLRSMLKSFKNFEKVD